MVSSAVSVDINDKKSAKSRTPAHANTIEMTNLTGGASVGIKKDGKKDSHLNYANNECNEFVIQIKII